MMQCRICKENSEEVFKTKILNKHFVHYFYCTYCGFLQTEEPYWLKEAYTESINLTDTGILERNFLLSEKTSAVLFKFFNCERKFLDYAGGYGVFTRLMRDIGFDFYWHDPYTKNIFARGFEFNQADSIELVTSFESFEHFVNPMEEITGMLKISPHLLFSTRILPLPIPKPGEWDYYGTEHGQHISFYSGKTLEFIAGKFDLHFHTFGSYLHLFTSKDIKDRTFKHVLKNSKKNLEKVRNQIGSKTVADMNFIKSILAEK